MNRRIFWIVEDGVDTATVLTCYIMDILPHNILIRTVNSCKEVKANPNDIILCDYHGVDLEYLVPNGAIVLTMSGDSKIQVDLTKPFDQKRLETLIKSRVSLSPVIKQVA